MPTITSITITKNAGPFFAKCLDSLQFCDQRVVVDSGSTDGTVDLARQKGALVVHQDWLGFGPQKNFGLTLATGDWIFWLDHDEEVTPELAEAIRKAVQAGDVDGYRISRLSWFCGQPMRHSGWHPDWVLRLFRRTKGQWAGGMTHDHVACDGPVQKLSGGLILHYPIHSLEDARAKADYYSTVGAKEMIAKGRRVSFTSGITHGLFAFFRTFVLQLGFLDGARGFLLATSNAEGTYYRYMKAWLAGQRRD
jgi:glycosyltransferase involved in cell wall biosynthesis